MLGTIEGHFDILLEGNAENVTCSKIVNCNLMTTLSDIFQPASQKKFQFILNSHEV